MQERGTSRRVWLRLLSALLAVSLCLLPISTPAPTDQPESPSSVRALAGNPPAILAHGSAPRLDQPGHRPDNHTLFALSPTASPRPHRAASGFPADRVLPQLRWTAKT